MADYATLKVPELKKLLQEKQLPVTGNKADLIARLQEHDKANEEPEPAAAAAAPGMSDRSDGLDLPFLSSNSMLHFMQYMATQSPSRTSVAMTR